MVGYFEWTDSQLEVGRADAVGSPAEGHTSVDELLLVRDESAGFAVYTETLEITENVKLRFS